MSDRNVNGLIEVRLDVTLPDFTRTSVEEFLTRLGQVLRAEFDDAPEVHELIGIKAYPSAGGEVVDILGENY